MGIKKNFFAPLFKGLGASVRRAALALLLLMLTTATAGADSAFSGGDGSQNNPYKISSEADLRQLATDVNGGNSYSGKYFQQTANITLTQTFTSIGHYQSGGSKTFSGIYDGDSKTVSGLTVNGTVNMQGLFGQVENATIKNLTISGANVSSSASYVGVFVGYSGNGLTMTNCHAVNSTASSTGSNVGIFVGDFEGTGIIKQCTATGGSVSGNRKVGAIVGYAYATKQNKKIVGSTASGVTNGGAVVGANTNNCVQIIGSYAGNDYTITAGDNVTITYGKLSGYDDVTHPPFIKSGETLNITLGYTGSGDNIVYQATGALLNDACTQLSNATGNVTITATNVPRTDISGGSIADIALQTWTGSAITPELVVTVGNTTLTASTDYIANYTDNTHIGTATVTVTGTGAYTGSLSKTFEIGISDITYNATDDCYEIGSETALRKLATYVNSGGATSGRSFVQTDNITLTSGFSPIGTGSSNNFQGTYDGGNKTISGLSVSGNIVDAALFGYMTNSATVKNVILINPSISSNSNGNGYGNNVSALVGYMNSCTIDNCIVINPTLSATGDYQNQNKVGVFVAELGNSTISNCYYYSVANYDIKGTQYGTVTNVHRVYKITATGCTVAATATVSVGSTDYYKQGTTLTVNATVPTSGMKKFTITGATASLTETLGQYTLTMPTNDVTVSLADVTPTITVAEATYTGSAQTPAITSVMDGSTAMTADTDYTGVTYSNNINAGTNTASVTITGKGIYLGTASQTFSISPASVTLTANSRNTDVYDGTEKTVTGFTSSVNGLTFAGVTASGSGTNAGEYDVTFSGVTLNTTKDETGNYVITATTNGKLTINPASVTLTANSDTKAYSGVEQTVEGFTCSVDGLTFTGVSASGSGTNTGTYDVTFSGVTISETKDNTGNYVVTETTNGTLTIVAKSVTIDGVSGGPLSFTQDQNGYTAKFDGTSEADLNITTSVAVKDVQISREFHSGQASTVMLPFDYTCNDSEGGKFYAFVGVAWDNTEGKWIATMKEPGNTAVTELTANTPYLFMPSGATMSFPNIPNMTGAVVTLKPASEGGYCSGTSGDANWAFHGTYTKKTWTSSDSDKDYGFAATSGTATDGTTAITAGQFVRFAPGAWMKPMRCYLSYIGSDPALARGLTRSASDGNELPQSITVRLLSRGGDTTAIGTLDTKTGELSFDGWYDMNGRKLDGKPTKKGLYINNGKKIVIK